MTERILIATERHGLLYIESFGIFTAGPKVAVTLVVALQMTVIVVCIFIYCLLNKKLY